MRSFNSFTADTLGFGSIPVLTKCKRRKITSPPSETGDVTDVILRHPH